MTPDQATLRDLPSVDRLAADPRLVSLYAKIGRLALVDQVRRTIDEARLSVQAGHQMPAFDDLVDQVLLRAGRLIESPLRPVINATGVVIHTNLGRAPLSAPAIAAAEAVARGYSNLEYDLDAGARGSRDRHIERLLCHLTGAEAAMAVNNNASGLLLALSALASGQEAIVSRGQAVEIGGGFRIPDVMLQSGARLVEVGTTNRTYLRDYEAAIGQETAVLLRVHSSNFRVVGFTHEVSISELAGLASKRGVEVVDDLGSGCLLDTRRFGLAAEPLVGASVTAGAGIVCFSGDKLLGGPQAGLIVGRRALIDRLRRHPLARAVRIDKMTLAALLATLGHYFRGEAEQAIPVWRMIAASESELLRRANALAQEFDGEVIPGESTVGGGSLPGETLPTHLVALSPPFGAETLARALRMGRPSVVGRIEHDRFLIDPRTVLPEEENSLRGAVSKVLSGT